MCGRVCFPSRLCRWRCCVSGRMCPWGCRGRSSLTRGFLTTCPCRARCFAKDPPGVPGARLITAAAASVAISAPLAMLIRRFIPRPGPRILIQPQLGHANESSRALFIVIKTDAKIPWIMHPGWSYCDKLRRLLLMEDVQRIPIIRSFYFPLIVGAHYRRIAVTAPTPTNDSANWGQLFYPETR